MTLYSNLEFKCRKVCVFRFWFLDVWSAFWSLPWITVDFQPLRTLKTGGNTLGTCCRSLPPLNVTDTSVTAAAGHDSIAGPHSPPADPQSWWIPPCHCPPWQCRWPVTDWDWHPAQRQTPGEATHYHALNQSPPGCWSLPRRSERKSGDCDWTAVDWTMRRSSAVAGGFPCRPCRRWLHWYRHLLDWTSPSCRADSSRTRTCRCCRTRKSWSRPRRECCAGRRALLAWRPQSLKPRSSNLFNYRQLI